jgi:hypothetical protein
VRAPSSAGGFRIVRGAAKPVRCCPDTPDFIAYLQQVTQSCDDYFYCCRLLHMGIYMYGTKCTAVCLYIAYTCNACETVKIIAKTNS